MPDPLKREDEPVPRPRVAEPDDKRVPGSDDDVADTTETNIALTESETDHEVLPTPAEQQQDRETMEGAGDTAMSPTESPEDKADDIINSGIIHM